MSASRPLVDTDIVTAEAMLAELIRDYGSDAVEAHLIDLIPKTSWLLWQRVDSAAKRVANKLSQP